MEIVINTDDSAPLCAQLIGQIKRAVLRGRIGPGDALPSVQQLANDLKLDTRTVARAYHLLELDLVICTQRLRGVLVHPNAKHNSMRVGWSWCPLA